jgi:hypothetical protein
MLRKCSPLSYLALLLLVHKGGCGGHSNGVKLVQLVSERKGETKGVLQSAREGQQTAERPGEQKARAATHTAGGKEQNGTLSPSTCLYSSELKLGVVM